MNLWKDQKDLTWSRSVDQESGESCLVIACGGVFGYVFNATTPQSSQELPDIPLGHKMGNKGTAWLSMDLLRRHLNQKRNINRKIIYVMVCRLAALRGNDTIPTEDVIDLAMAVKLLMEQVFPIDTLVTIIHESEAKDAPNI